MKWEHETWRKLYCRVTATWQLLPLSARGLGDELIRYVDDDGLLPIGSEAPWSAVARILCAHPQERRRLKSDIAKLLEDGYLTLEPGYLKIRNLKAAQDRSGSAVRMARKRERDRAMSAKPPPDGNDVTSHQASRRASPQTSPSDTGDAYRSDGSRARGSVPFRSDQKKKPPYPPDGGAAAAAAAGASPEHEALLLELAAHRLFDELDHQHLADTAVRVMMAGKRLPWLLEAIRECQAKCGGLGLGREALQARLVGYLRSAKAPREPEAPARSSVIESPPDLPDSPGELARRAKLPAAIAAFDSLMAEKAAAGAKT
jgi:hypothetical protein